MMGIGAMFGVLLLAASHGSDDVQCFTVLHTNDWHSHVEGYPELDNHIGSVGGPPATGDVARLATLLSRERMSHPSRQAVLTLDSGDAMMGTLFSAIDVSNGVEYQLMESLGYDAVAIGNHDLDYTASGLAKAIQSAHREGNVPALLQGNWEISDATPGAQALKTLVAQRVIRPYVVVVRGGVRFGIFGLMGKEAAADVDARARKEVRFSDPIASARLLVNALRIEERVDVVIALSHSGVSVDKDGQVRGEDVDLAKSVPGIDLVVSGHSHSVLNKPFLVGRTPVVQAGAFMEYLGEISMCRSSDGWQLASYAMLPIDQGTLGSPQFGQKMSRWRGEMDQNVLSHWGLRYSQTVAHVDSAFTGRIGDETLGNLVTDAIRLSSEPKSDIAFLVGGDTGGVLRDNLVAGSTGFVTVSDVFRVTPLGSGADGQPGFPLVRVYLYGHELKGVINAVLFGGHRAQDPRDYNMHFSGLRVFYEPSWVPFLFSVTAIEIGNARDGYRKIGTSWWDHRLYPVVTDMYLAGMLGRISSLTYGLVSVVPKDASGARIQDLNAARILRASEPPAYAEIKEWQLVQQYLASYPIRMEGVADLRRERFIEQRVIPHKGRSINEIDDTKPTDNFGLEGDLTVDERPGLP